MAWVSGKGKGDEAHSDPCWPRVALILLSSVALVEPSATYELFWWTVDGGGYTLAGTAGQPDAGVLTGDGYTLAGGFWGGGAVTIGCEVYLALALRSYWLLGVQHPYAGDGERRLLRVSLAGEVVKSLRNQD